MRFKPTEKKLVLTHLMSEHPDAEALAETIITSLDEKRSGEQSWCVNFYDPNGKTLCTFGPYGTEGAAKKEMGKLVSAGPVPSVARVQKLRKINAE